ncbi:MAG: ELM1/GtrOC1 family putative glycosyltransferase [Spongiibacteraceae bacterium]
MITVWCVTDDKPGHKSQLVGLVKALAAKMELHCEWLSLQQKQQWPTTAKPDLILAAGSRTHIPALGLRWRYGGKLVILMKPFLPRFCFDLCLLPEHDGIKSNGKLVTTKGAINPVDCSEQSDPQRGLILIGGPSKHYGWVDQQIIEQLMELQRQQPTVVWTLTTSRRTPTTFVPALQAAMRDSAGANSLTIVPFEQTDSAWLLAQYRDCGVIWVTEDSVSMVYESLSSGAATGILSVPRLNQNRVSKGLDQLIVEQLVMQLTEDVSRVRLKHSPLREAERAAEIIIARLL